MTLKQITSLGQELARFLALFVECFRSQPGLALLNVYVRGLLSDEQRKNVEAIALRFGTAPRTLQRFLESIKWDESRLRDQCQCGAVLLVSRAQIRDSICGQQPTDTKIPAKINAMYKTSNSGPRDFQDPRLNCNDPSGSSIVIRATIASTLPEATSIASRPITLSHTTAG